MTDQPEHPDPPGWPADGRHSGRADFQQALRACIAQAQAERVGQMWWCDPDFADWPLHEAAVVAQLQAWSLAGGRLRMLASDFRHVQAHAPRFLRWRQLWDHRFEARATGRSRWAETPSLWLGGERLLLRLDAVGSAFFVTTERARRAQTEERLQSLWQQSVVALPASTLGL
ncbi:hypothetical protein [Aquabacterium sp. A08]|uniref:hypothetical protein n=1 Tax=Aquabacterium sp. A08 TaxID=2718532 RepID=UPI00141DD06D|nr:hypothetical protein [Aquabacterium sp. A08]NIC41773.1 hypothetical protein [Aquabacterium sp. A08]NIC41802.1 hypothetical protein [Aquabacterium sp. A08]